jgi:hypothetical protein
MDTNELLQLLREVLQLNAKMVTQLELIHKRIESLEHNDYTSN